MASLRPFFRPSVYRMARKSWSTFNISKRTLLSPAYSCQSVWESKLQNPMLRDLDLYDFIVEIQKQVQYGHPVSAIDVDVLLHCVSESEQLDEAIGILYKFRHSSKAAEIMSSTHSAFVRSCMQHGRDETLMLVLDDPINYGIFLDSHDANILMDYFLTKGNHRDAAKIASKIMLQEDFQRPSTCWLAALSCLKWIKQPQATVPSVEVGAEPAVPVEQGNEQKADDDEEIIMRLPYLKNYYYDDHFDITDLPVLVGKTLAWTSRSLPNKQLSLNLMALGYGVKKDNKYLKQTLRQMLDTKSKFYAEVGKHILAAKSEGQVEGAKPAEEAEPGKEAPPETPDPELEEIKALIDQFHKSGLVIQEDLEQTVSKELGKILPELEAKDIQERTAQLQKWTEMQQKRVENQVLKYLKNERIKEIEKNRRDLQETEEYLNFFENRTKLEVSVHPELLKQEEETKQRAKAEQQQLPSDEKYVIPDLQKPKEQQQVEF